MTRVMIAVIVAATGAGMAHKHPPPAPRPAASTASAWSYAGDVDRASRSVRRPPLAHLHAPHRRHVASPRTAATSPSPVPAPATTARRSVWQRWLDVTAYCATGSRTASGEWPVVGMAATYDRSVPFGTRVIVPGVGRLVVTDRIGSGSDLDIYMGGGAACQRAAERWGRRRLRVEAVAG